MQAWQWIILAFLAVVPAALMLDFWGPERQSSRGRPRPRAWRPTPRPAPDEDDHH